MRKLILLLSLVIITSCSSSSDDESSNNEQTGKSFNPPAWIQGSWKGPYDSATYIFTNDDILYTVSGTTHSLKAEANGFEKMGIPVSISESDKDGTYTVDYSFTKETTTRYSFTKISDTQINATGYLSGTYTKQ